eukprot:scaffold3103_cov136-Cylindrotheca_fusiformis.AAC.28
MTTAKSSPSHNVNRVGEALVSNEPVKDQQPSFPSLQSLSFQCGQKPFYRALNPCLSSPFRSSSYPFIGERDNTSFFEGDIRDFDRDLASTMAKLSVKDRETALEEVNGIANCVEEEADAMEVALRELEEHLNDIKAGTAYEEAEQMDASHVSDRAFRVMFLRGKRYHPKEAAKQMIAFFDSKRMLFGRDLLAKQITLNDLDENDREAIRGGSYQVLPQRDRSGRQIILEFWGFKHFKSPKNEMRSKYYTLMSMVESEEDQKKGIVVILYLIGKFREKKNRAGIVELAKVVQSIPLHLAGFHFCCDDYKQYLMLWPVLGILPTERVARFRYHHGAHMECEYSLRSIGIPEGSMPISPWTGEVLMRNHLVWYRERQILEAERDRMHGKRPCRATISAKPNGGSMLAIRDACVENRVAPDLGSHFGLDAAPRAHIIIELPRDVIFGLRHKCHPGTVRLHEIITENKAEYDTILDRRRKTDFVAGLVQRIKSTGSRFLVYKKSIRQFEEIDDTLARNKISKIIRNRQRIRGC